QAGAVPDVLHESERAAGVDDRPVPVAPVGPAVGRDRQRTAPRFERREEELLRDGRPPRRLVVADPAGRRCDNRLQAAGRGDGTAEEGFAGFQPDVVVHAAARIGVLRCEEEPALAVRSNVLATVRVAQACAAHGARLTYLSTADVYGLQAVADEETPPAPASL